MVGGDVDDVQGLSSLPHHLLHGQLDAGPDCDNLVHQILSISTSLILLVRHQCQKWGGQLAVPNPGRGQSHLWSWSWRRSRRRRRQSSRSRRTRASSLSLRNRWKNLLKNQNFHTNYWNVFSDSHLVTDSPSHSGLCLPRKLVHVMGLQWWTHCSYKPEICKHLVHSVHCHAPPHSNWLTCLPPLPHMCTCVSYRSTGSCWVCQCPSSGGRSKPSIILADTEGHRWLGSVAPAAPLDSAVSPPLSFRPTTSVCPRLN